MKSIYLLALVMFAGLALLFYSSYHLVDAVQQNAGHSAPKGGITPQPELRPYVFASYTGITLFIIGGVGGLIAAFRAIAHRF